MADYVRPAGLITLLPPTSLNWWGPGSRKATELYDCVSRNGYLGTSSLGTVDTKTGFAQKEMVWSKERYLALRPSPVPADMNSSEWTAGTFLTDQGTYDYQRPGAPPAKVHLLQTDSTPTKSFSRVSTFHHARDASFAFRIQVGAASADSDPDGPAPFVALAWGSGSWAIFFIDRQSPILAEWVPDVGQWVARKKLPTPPKPPKDDPGDLVVCVENKREAVFVYMQFVEDVAGPVEYPPEIPVLIPQTEREAASEDEHEAYYSPRPAPHWESGTFQLFGYGLAVAFELDTVAYASSATWDSARAPLQEPRGNLLGTDVPTFSYYGNENGGSIALARLNGSGDYWFQYRATMTPWSQTIGSRTWYRTPDLEGVAIFYPSITVPGFATPGDFGQTLEGRILSCRVSKPEQLSDSHLSARLFFPDGFLARSAPWRFRPMKAYLGWEFPAGVQTQVCFSGFITSMEGEQGKDTVVEVEMEAAPGIIRMKRMRFGPTTAPRGARTLNQILDLWCDQLAIPASDRLWHSDGSILVLGSGTAEEPALLPNPDSDAWEWHARLCEMHGLELIWTDDGQVGTFRKHDYIPTPATWYAQPLDPVNGIQSLHVREDVLGMYTRLVCTCKSEYGGLIQRWSWNPWAEQDPAYAFFRPWPDQRTESVDLQPLNYGAVGEALLNVATLNLTYDYLIPRFRAAWEGEFSPLIGRRMAVTIIGDRMQVAGIYVVESIEHMIEENDFQSRTRLSGFRLGP